MPLLVLIIGLITGIGGAIVFTRVLRTPAIQAGAAIGDAARELGKAASGLSSFVRNPNPLLLIGAGALLLLLLRR